MELIAIAAVSIDGIIGVDSEIPWHIPEDFKHYRQTTTGHYVLVGYNTYLTLPEKAFQNRIYIILVQEQHSDVIVNDVSPNEKKIFINNISLLFENKLNIFNNIEKIFIAGGEMVYNSLIDYCSEAIITWVNKNIPNGNKKFPINKLFDNFDEEITLDWKKSSSGISYKIVYYVNSNLKFK